MLQCTVRRRSTVWRCSRRFPFDEVTPRLPGDDADDHARFLEAVVSTGGGVLRVASIYLPNGNPPDSDKYSYKISWMDRLIALCT